ncbi:MAG: DUF4190 domain-containing protein [Phycisphaerales bacterium]|nr:DUF4190 domain-containing protein [Phycisphaerales bacterium]
MSVVEPPPIIQPSGYACIECGYDLSGTAIGGQCPECGRAIVDSLRARQSEMPASSMPVTSLILGILGVVACSLCAPAAWYLGAKARRDIREGAVSAAGQGMATAGWILGMIGTALIGVSLLFLVISMSQPF